MSGKGEEIKRGVDLGIDIEVGLEIGIGTGTEIDREKDGGSDLDRDIGGVQMIGTGGRDLGKEEGREIEIGIVWIGM